MARPFLLDVNALIALFDSAHVHHLAAHDWFARNKNRGWRTCPIVENGVLRILSNAAYPNDPMPIIELAQRLEEFKKAAQDYEFWPDDFSASEWLIGEQPVVSSSKLTDAYLLKLAVNRGGALATLDARIEPKLIGQTEAELVAHIPA